jgi:hypothetical protein
MTGTSRTQKVGTAAATTPSRYTATIGGRAFNPSTSNPASRL